MDIYNFRKSSDLFYVNIDIEPGDIMVDGSVNYTAELQKQIWRIDLVDFMATGNPASVPDGTPLIMRLENPRSVRHINIGFNPAFPASNTSNTNQVSNKFRWESSVPIPICRGGGNICALYQPQQPLILSIDDNMGNYLNMRLFFTNFSGVPIGPADNLRLFIRLLCYTKPEVLFKGTNVGLPYTLRLNH